MNQQPISREMLLRLRQDTPGVQHRLHFNNAGASLPTEAVLQTVTDYLREEALYGGMKRKQNTGSQIAGVFVLKQQQAKAF